MAQVFLEGASQQPAYGLNQAELLQLAGWLLGLRCNDCHATEDFDVDTAAAKKVASSKKGSKDSKKRQSGSDSKQVSKPSLWSPLTLSCPDLCS